MRVAVDVEDVGVSADELEAVSREVSARVRSPAFDGARDLLVRLRHVKGALLCVVAVGFSAGDLVTSTATSSTPLGAMVSALDGLPERMERVPRFGQRAPTHAAVRNKLRLLLG